MKVPRFDDDIVNDIINRCNEKRGFTLVEILAIVTLIGLIFLLVIPKITNSLKNKKNVIDGTTNNIILASAKLYVMEHISRFEKVSGNVSCISLKQLIKSGYLEEPVRNVTDDIDISDSKSAKITYDKGFEYEIVDRNDCIAFETKVVRYLNDVLVKKANRATITSYVKGNSHQMYTFSHTATSQTPDFVDYRYIGSTPDNYVEYNGELWRIIGVFNVENSNGELVEIVFMMEQYQYRLLLFVQ